MRTLHGPRLTATPVAETDLRDLHAHMADFEVAKWTATWPYPGDLEFTRSRCRPNAEPGRGLWILRVDGVCVGSIGYSKQSIGYAIAPGHWGQGYASEAVALALRELFQTTDWPAVSASVWHGNAASERVLEKAGFRRIGGSTGFCRARNEDLDAHDFTLTRTDWAQRNPLRITTPRLVMRPLGPEDAAEVLEHIGDQRVARNVLSIPWPWSLPQARDWCETHPWTGAADYRLAVRRADGTFVGVGNIRGGLTQTSVGYMIAPRAQGQGYATEIARALLIDAFDRYPITEISAGVAQDNAASLHILDKLGFERVAEGMAKSPARVEPMADYKYRLLRSSFEDCHEIS